MAIRRNRPGTASQAAPKSTRTDCPQSNGSAGQIPPVGPEPVVADLLVGALMYSTAAEANAVLGLIVDDDADPPLSVLLSTTRSLAAQGIPPSPQLVADGLRRTGSLTRQVAVALAAATTTGACSAAARCYAAAVVAESLRRRVESFGAALTSAARDAAEVDLAPLVERATESVLDCARRLAALRGESI